MLVSACVQIATNKRPRGERYEQLGGAAFCVGCNTTELRAPQLKRTAPAGSFGEPPRPNDGSEDPDTTRMALRHEHVAATNEQRTSLDTQPRNVVSGGLALVGAADACTARPRAAVLPRLRRNMFGLTKRTTTCWCETNARANRSTTTGATGKCRRRRLSAVRQREVLKHRNRR